MPLPVLPRRLSQVLQLLLQGLSEKQIARRLGLSPHTVHSYCKSLHKVFGAASRGELLSIVYRMLLDDARRAMPAPQPLRVGVVVPVRRSVGGDAHEAVYQPGC